MIEKPHLRKPRFARPWRKVSLSNYFFKFTNRILFTTSLGWIDSTCVNIFGKRAGGRTGTKSNTAPLSYNIEIPKYIWGFEFSVRRGGCDVQRDGKVEDKIEHEAISAGARTNGARKFFFENPKWRVSALEFSGVCISYWTKVGLEAKSNTAWPQLSPIPLSTSMFLFKSEMVRSTFLVRGVRREGGGKSGMRKQNVGVD